MNTGQHNYPAGGAHRSDKPFMAPANTKVVEPIPKPSSTDQGSKPPQKKRKKNVPGKPQPEWMFPPDEENPVLNPKPKSDARVIKEQKEREAAIEFLHYKSVSTPKKPAPPGMLLTLVGAFLTSYGFDHASRLYTTQCKARKKLDAWDHELGVKLPKGMPSLERIFKDWYKDYERTRQEETSSSSDEPSESEARKLPKSNKNSKASNVGQTQGERTPSSGSSNANSDTSSEDSESDSEPVKISDGQKGIKSSAKNKDVSDSSSSSSPDSEAEAKASVEVSKTAKKPKKVQLSSGSSSVSSSESDADDEKEAPGARVSSPKPTINALVDNLKRKADSRGSSSSGSTPSCSSSDDGDDGTPPSKKTKLEITEGLALLDEPTAKKAKVNRSKASPTNVVQRADITLASSSDSSLSESPVNKLSPTSSSSDSSSSSESEAPTAPIKFAKASKPKNPEPSSASSKSTESSATLEGATSGKPSTSNTSSSSSKSSAIENEPVPTRIEPKAVQKRKRSPSPSSARADMPPSKSSKHKEGPFQRVPKDTKIDLKLASNKYVSYDYAEQAHRDLSVAKGKGYKKEKNKKKRGSYRGGMIDVDGRKGIKFDD